MKSLAILFLFGLTACSTFKPVVDRSRFFVLTEVKCPHSETGSLPLPIGIGKIELPDYLKSKGIAVRVGNSEVKVSDTCFWAERLDSSIQRVIARDMNLTNVYFSAWKREAVALELYVAIEQFDPSENGTAMLRARYRLTTSGAAQTLFSGVAEFSRDSASLANNAPATIQSLSALIGELSCELADRVAHLNASR